MRGNTNYDSYKSDLARFFAPIFLANFVSLHFILDNVVLVDQSIKITSVFCLFTSRASYVPKHFFFRKNNKLFADNFLSNIKKVAEEILNFKKISIIGHFVSCSRNRLKIIKFARLFWELIKLYAISVLATLSIAGYFTCCDNKLYIISFLATLAYVVHLAVRSKPNVAHLVPNFGKIRGVAAIICMVILFALYYRLLVFSIIMIITLIVIGCFDAVLKQPCVTESRFRQRRTTSCTVPKDHLFDANVKLRGHTFDLICVVYFMLFACFLLDSLRLIFLLDFFLRLSTLHLLILICFVIFFIYFALKMSIDINFRSAFRRKMISIAVATANLCISPNYYTLTENLFVLPLNWIESVIWNTKVANDKNNKTLGYTLSRRSVKTVQFKISASLILLTLCFFMFMFSANYFSFIPLNLKIFLLCIYFLIILGGHIGSVDTKENAFRFPVRKNVIMSATFLTMLVTCVMTLTTPETPGLMSATPLTTLSTYVALTPTVMPTFTLLPILEQSGLASLNLVCIFNSYLSSVISISTHLTKKTKAFKFNLLKSNFSLHVAGRNIVYDCIMFLKQLDDRFYAKTKTVSPNNLNDALGKIISSLHFRLDALSIDKKIIKNLHFLGLRSKHLTFESKNMKSYYNVNFMTFSDGEFSQKTLLSQLLNSHILIIYNLDCIRSQAYCHKMKQNVFIFYRLHYIYWKYKCLLVSSCLWFHRDSIGWPLSTAAHESVCSTLSMTTRDNICSILNVLDMSTPTCDNVCSTLFVATRDDVCSSFSMAARETLSVLTCENIPICDSNYYCTILSLPSRDNIPLSMPTHDKMAAMSDDEILSILSFKVNSLGVVDIPSLPNIMNVLLSKCKQYLHVCNQCCDYNIDHNLTLYVIDNSLLYLWWNVKNNDADNVMNDPIKLTLKCESLPM